MSIAGQRGQGIVPPFAGNGIGADQHLLADYDAAADTGAENDAEHGLGVAAAAVDGFRQGKAVGVVGQSHLALEQGLQVAAQGLADQAGGVGVLDAPADRGNGAGDANAQGARLA